MMLASRVVCMRGVRGESGGFASGFASGRVAFRQGRFHLFLGGLVIRVPFGFCFGASLFYVFWSSLVILVRFATCFVPVIFLVQRCK